MNFSRSGDISPERRTFCDPFIGDKDDMLVAARSCAQAMKVSRICRRMSPTPEVEEEEGRRPISSKKCENGVNWMWQAVGE